MNYYFFLNTENKDLNSSIDICNFPPTNLINNYDLKKKLFVYLFYTDGINWKFRFLDEVDVDCSKKINKSEIDTSNIIEPFILISYKKVKNTSQIFENTDDFNSIPSWRCNISLSSNFTSCSYQGEYPLSLTNNLSIVSCSPLFNKKSINYFSLINIQKDPSILTKKIEILNLNKKKIGEIFVKTNTVNFVNLNEHFDFNKDDFYIFKSTEIGGIPIYLTISENLKHLSCEHTHPPVEYLLEGDRIYFQKIKKNYWFN